MKEQYEHRTRFFVPRRTFTIIRLDGKAFHTYTRNFQKPFDDGLSEDIDNAIVAMLPEIQGVEFAYTQSDEISLLLTDFATPNTDAWFDGNIQKMCSVSSSLITAEFNNHRLKRFARWMDLTLEEKLVENTVDTQTLAFFDSRVFTIPDRIEVMNYFIWRNQDCARNSVSMVAQSLFSHGELQGKSTAEMQEMIYQKEGINWADYDQAKKNGRLIVKEEYTLDIEHETTKWSRIDEVKRTRWVSKPAWKFTEDKDKLLAMIPTYT